MLYNKISKCRISGDKNLILVAKFPSMGLTGTFPKSKQQKIPKTPMELVFSNKSKLLQLKHNCNSKILYGKNYGYRSGLNDLMVKHLKKKYFYLKKKLKILKSDYILDIGSNDSTFLNFFNCKRIGIDPSIIKFKKNYNKSIETHPETFDEAYSKIKKKKFKLITAIAMFYDLENPVKCLNKIKKILDKKGILHIEVAYLPEIIKKFSYDTFCQEHYEYYSMQSLMYMCKMSNMKILDVEFNKINGGSIWINVSHEDSLLKPNNLKIARIIKKEKKEKIDKIITYKKYFKKVFDHSKKLAKILKKIKIKKNNNIYGYGASTKGNVLLQLSKIDNKTINKIFEINKEKFNKFTPISKIRIVNELEIRKIKPDYILILIWHFGKSIIKKIKKFSKKTKIIIPFPKIKIIS